MEIHYLSPTNVLLTWNQAQAVVEESGELPATHWRTPPQTPAFNGSEYSLVLPVTDAARFYRLLTGLPADPVLTAPAVDATVPTEFATATEFLYSGDNSIQTGVSNGVIDSVRAAVVRGQVRQRDEAPLPGVSVTMLDHPEFGQTLTRSDGTFDLAMNGGGLFTIVYRKDGFLPAQRQVTVPWRDFVCAPDAILVPLDPAVTTVAFGSNAAPQVARGSVQTDADGTRQATLLFPAGTCANLVFADGSTQSCSSLNIRATEYTVGPNGPEAMPAELPPTSFYTYCVELSADEALAAGAKTVAFDRPVSFYVENFRGFPVGIQVPFAFYDSARDTWVPIDDGRVVRIVSITDGVAQLDTDGDGTADDGLGLGVTLEERQMLAQLYLADQTLQRMVVEHFSPHDPNYGVSPEDGAENPSQPDPTDNRVDNGNEQDGFGRLQFENQTMTESIPIVGTPFTLNYRSDGVPAYLANNVLNISLSGTSVPPVLRGIELKIEIAGRVFTNRFAPLPNQTYTFQWDGRDAYGRMLQGEYRASVELAYLYHAYYNLPPSVRRSFGLASGVRIVRSGTSLIAGNIRAPFPARLFQRWQKSLGGFRPDVGLGGWTLDAHHVYDPRSGRIYLGNGSQRSASVISSQVRLAAGAYLGCCGDGGPAVLAGLRDPNRVVFAPDGTFYICDNNNDRIRRVTPDGIITTYAGGGTGGDGVLATNALVNDPIGIALAPDGVLYIAERAGQRIRVVRTNGIISTIAGDGVAGFAGDGGPALLARFNSITDIALAPDGSLYVVDTSNRRIRRIAPDGIVNTVVGTGTCCFTGDGGPATLARSNPITARVAPDGSLYLVDGNRIRRVTPDGIINTIAGTGSSGFAGDGGPAALARLWGPRGMDFGADGALYIADASNHRVRRIGLDGIISTVLGNGRQQAFSGEGAPPTGTHFSRPVDVRFAPDGSLFAVSSEERIVKVTRVLPQFAGGVLFIPSEDASMVYKFDQEGRHLETLHALTGAALYRFGYDGLGRLIQVEDGDGKVTTIQRSAFGAPAAIVGPFGQSTTLTLNGDRLATVASPAGEAIQLGYSGGGLLTSVTGPKGDAYTFTYDALGRLIGAEDPAGGSTTLVRTETTTGHEVQATTAMGRVSRYLVERLFNGSQRRRTIYPDDTVTEIIHGSDGRRTTTLPDGTAITSVEGPDPRFGMQAPVLTNRTIRAPSGLSNVVTSTRTVNLTNAADPFSLSSIIETFVANGRTSTVTYAASTRIFVATSPEGRRSTNQIDALGRPVFAQTAGLHPTRYSYDALGRLTNIVAGTGADLRSSQMTYDSFGRLATLVDAIGRTNRFEYDNANRLTQQHLPGNRTVGFGYDLSGRTASVTPPGRPAHRFTNSIINLLARYTPPDVDGLTEAESYLYNADRQSTNVLRADGETVAFNYDGTRRLTLADYPNFESLSYVYHPTSGLITGVNSSDGNGQTFARDGLLLTNETWSGAVTGSVSFRYDRDFRVTNQLVNGLGPISFSYDRDNLPTNAGAMRLVYDSRNGLLTSTTLGAVRDTRGYNAFGEMTNYTAAFSNSPLYSYSLSLDTLGRITNKTETIGGQTTIYGYTYDDAGRLWQVHSNGVLASTYTYDLNGNRLQLEQGAKTSVYTYDDRDRLRQRTVGGQAADYQWTPNGELRTQTVASASASFNYDPRGNLRELLLPNGTRLEYLTDGNSRRIGKKVNGALVRGWLYEDGLHPVAELDGAGNVVSRFAAGYMINAGVTNRILRDHLGSPRLVVNAQNGAIAQRIDYDEFGVVLADTNPGFQSFGFASGLYDPDTSLVRFGARDYDPNSGRFTDRDPIGFNGRQANLYLYVNGDPQNLVDPYGLGTYLLEDDPPDPAEDPYGAAAWMAALLNSLFASWHMWGEWSQFGGGPPNPNALSLRLTGAESAFLAALSQPLPLVGGGIPGASALGSAGAAALALTEGAGLLGLGLLALPGAVIGESLESAPSRSGPIRSGDVYGGTITKDFRGINFPPGGGPRFGL